MNTKLVAIKRTVTDQVPLGYYLVSFDAIWGHSCVQEPHDSCEQAGCFDSEPDRIADVDGSIVRVTKSNYREIDATGMTLESNANDTYVSGDTHDLRPRLFKTKAEAQAHLDYTLKRFANPQPWECFIKTA